MSFYVCKCEGELWIPGPVAVRVCTRCGNNMIASRTISRRRRRSLKSATWESAGQAALNLAAHIERTTVCQAQIVPEESALGRAFASSLSTPRDWDEIHRNTGFLAGRPGFASSDFKSRGRLKKALVRVLEPEPLRLHLNANETTPMVQGKLVEAEFAFRCGRRASRAILSPEKELIAAVHPVLDLPFTVSSDGKAASAVPLEIKTTESVESPFKTLVLHQVALQAYAFGMDEAVLLRIERRYDGRGRYVALLIGNLLDFHRSLVESWLTGDEELAALLQDVRRLP